jgi:ABC-type transporter Mla subunit MlaD
LATQTAKSTEQIGAKVAEIQSTTREVVAALSGVAEAIDQLSDVTVSVYSAVEEQRDATDNFASSAREITAAVSDVAGRMAGIADMVQRSRVTAQDVSAVAKAMQSTSEILCREIPGIVQKAVNADLREFPRYEVKLTARLERDGQVAEVTVHDISEGGALIDGTENLALGDLVGLAFPDMKAISAEVVRNASDGFGLCFKPARLRLEELRDLVTSQERAA